MTSRLLRILRSRTLAIWLLLLVAAWSMLGTVVPQESLVGAPAVSAWRAAHPLGAILASSLGLYQPFSAPVFVVLVILLTASTTVCAVDRTRRAWRLLRESQGIASGLRGRLDDSPQIRVPTGLSSSQALSAAASGLRSNGFKVRSTGTALQATSRSWGLLGSPVFHWSLTLLVLVIFAGQLTRSEGQLGVPLGTDIPNAVSEYKLLERGRLYPDAFRDASFSLVSMPLNEERSGVEIGPIPTVRLLREGKVVAEGEVYPNHPLRYRSMLLHFVAYGYTAVAEVTDSSGQRATTRVFFDFDASGRFAPTNLDIGAGQSGTLHLTVVPLTAAPSTPGSRRRLTISYSMPSGDDTSTIVAVGQHLQVEGHTVTFRDDALYARMTVVDDWSAYVIYALFVTATLGILVSVLLPRRQVWVSAPADGARSRLHVIVRHERNDQVFPASVEELLKNAVLAVAGTEVPSSKSEQER